MSSMAATLRRFALVSVAVVGACYSADKDSDNGSGGSGGACFGVAVPCRCVDGSNGLADCVDGARQACMCDGNGGNGGFAGTIAGSGGTTAGTAGTAGTGAAGAAGEGGSGGTFVAECTPGGFEACTCSIADGYRICHPPGTWGDCTCGKIFVEGDEPVGGAGGAGGAGGDSGGAAGAGGACAGDDEICDAADNDCDGLVDEGYVCSDDTVHHIVQLTRGIYLQGTTNEGSCGYDALQQFWPTLVDYYYDGFDCDAERYLFRRTDNQIFYKAELDGIYQNTASGTTADSLLTTSCGATVTQFFDFDSDNDFHYQCSDQLVRGGQVVTYPITRIVAVLDDGRIVATRNASFPLDSEYVVFDAGGTPVSVFPTPDAIAGTLTLNAQAVVMGNTAYLTMLRSFNAEDEVMVWRLTESSQWQLVRRVVVDDVGTSIIASPEGTVLVRGIDPVSGSDERIVAYMVDGTDFVVWSEAESATVKAYNGDQLLPGPLQ